MDEKQLKTIDELSQEFGITRWMITKAIVSGKIIAEVNRYAANKKGQSKYMIDVESFKKWFNAVKLLHPELISKQDRGVYENK